MNGKHYSLSPSPQSSLFPTFDQPQHAPDPSYCYINNDFQDIMFGNGASVYGYSGVIERAQIRREGISTTGGRLELLDMPRTYPRGDLRRQYGVLREDVSRRQ
jgi:hypothetical protein